VLVAETGGVEEAVDGGDAEVPGFDQMIGGGEGCEGLFEFV
jgi:hypothetical protein